jgi:hypothetical protein
MTSRIQTPFPPEDANGQFGGRTYFMNSEDPSVGPIIVTAGNFVTYNPSVTDPYSSGDGDGGENGGGGGEPGLG